jgi:DNA-directed RNA polymerase specialized sigma24 family protein
VDVEQLIRRAQAGDPKARNQLARWINAKLYRFFRNRFQDQDAADLTQSVVEVILSNLNTFEIRGPNSFERYVGRVAGIQAKSSQRDGAREKAGQAKLGTGVVIPELSPPSVILAQEQRALLWHWIPKLPDIHRRALEHWLAGGDDKTFALREDIAVSSARSRRRYARTLLRALIEQARLTPLVCLSPSTS